MIPVETRPRRPPLRLPFGPAQAGATSFNDALANFVPAAAAKDTCHIKLTD